MTLIYLSSAMGAAIGAVVGFVIGSWQGWRLGRKYGEADGIAWATERLQDARITIQHVNLP